VSTATKPRAAAVYARISQDGEGSGLGVKRQEADCRELAERRGWPIAEVFVDNDVSAYNGKGRASYKRLLADIEAGRVDAVIVWHLDRLHRQPKELETFIEVCQQAGVTDVATVTGNLDVGNDDGLFQARILTAVAAKESADKARRIRRKHEELAANGHPLGGVAVPFGYRYVRPTRASPGAWRSWPKKQPRSEGSLSTTATAGRSGRSCATTRVCV
jgi:site-specific DNA recombinase